MAATIRVSRSYPPPDIVVRSIDAATTRISARIEIYEQDAKTRWAYDTENRLVDGSVSVDYGRDERRTLTLTLDNVDNVLVSAPGFFWYDKIIKVYRQVRVRAGNYDAWEYQLGEFMIDSIDEDNFPHQSKISGRDYTKKLLLAKFTVTTQFSGTYSLEYLVQTIATNGGITKMIMPTTGLSVKDLTANRGQTRWEVIKQIAADNNYDVFFDNAGYLRLTPMPDPFLGTPVYVFKTGASGNLASYAKSTDDTQIYNHVLVTGKDTSGLNLPPYAEAINTDPNSPTNVNEIGDRLYEWDSDTITYRTNYSVNPKASVNTTNFDPIPGTGGAATLTRFATVSALGYPAGVSSKAVYTWTTATTAVSGGLGNITAAGSVVSGEFVSASVNVLASTAQAVQIQIAWLNAAGGVVSTVTSAPVTVLVANQWRYLKIENQQAPDNTDHISVKVVAVAGNAASKNWAVNDLFQMSAVLIEKETSVGSYFDGDSYASWWTGTTGSSTAISNLQAQTLADAFLKIHALEQYSVSLDALNHFYLDVGQVVEFDDPRPAPGDPTRFLLQSLTIPIKLGPMSGTAGRVLNVGGG